ncbi:nitroreductase family protein [Marinivivus vitaminiproducens]|uniref:nitroreductase family protein n=1 Tax=Marinivivus vitaminiproducens TaxID=3035935 RepID=UPI00279FDE3C|nr:nitroreductase [Geminicoccaceae bacterium SCSIO 64248]
MDALEALLTRTTVPQAMMAGPGPEGDALDLILQAGIAAPDHGKLRPWRFLLIRGEGLARLGEVFVSALLERQPDAPEGVVEKARTGPLRAPLIVVVVGAVQPDHPKIPEIEQIGSAAAAAQNMLIAAHALGFAGKWSTGGNAYDRAINQALGLAAHEHLIGYLYFGTSRAARDVPDRPGVASLVAEWPPAGA